MKRVLKKPIWEDHITLGTLALFWALICAAFSVGAYHSDFEDARVITPILAVAVLGHLVTSFAYFSRRRWSALAGLLTSLLIGGSTLIFVGTNSLFWCAVALTFTFAVHLPPRQRA